MATEMCRIVFTRRPSAQHKAGRNHYMVAHGIEVSTADYREKDVVFIAPVNSAGGDGGVHIAVPFDHIPELVTALNRMIAGPLGNLVLDAEQGSAGDAE